MPHIKARALTTPEIALIAGTRVAAGVGIGLLVSERAGFYLVDDRGDHDRPHHQGGVQQAHSHGSELTRHTHVDSTRRLLRLSAQRLSLVVVVAVVLGVNACTQASHEATSPLAGEGWLAFQGTWIATGTRDTLLLGSGRRASIASFDGSLVLTGSSKPAVGFRAEAIVFSDSESGGIGRAVWTDDRGDQVFSELTGQGAATGKQITGTFVGGTGRYAGATGTYVFAWRYLINNDEGKVQGQSSGLKGRVRFAASLLTPGVGGTQTP